MAFAVRQKPAVTVAEIASGPAEDGLDDKTLLAGFGGKIEGLHALPAVELEDEREEDDG